MEVKKSNPAGTKELEKSKSLTIAEMIEYVPNSIVTKTIIKKTTGNVTVMSSDEGGELGEKTLPYETFAQIIDGEAEIIIDEKKYKLKLGEGIIIPANVAHCINASEPFKMISTGIKCP